LGHCEDISGRFAGFSHGVQRILGALQDLQSDALDSRHFQGYLPVGTSRDYQEGPPECHQLHWLDHLPGWYRLPPTAQVLQYEGDAAAAGVAAR